MIAAASEWAHARGRWLCYAGFAVQLASAFALGWLVPLSFLPILTIVWLAMAASFLSLRICVAALFAISAAWYAIFSFGGSESNPLLTVALYGTFHAFALASARVAHRAEAASAAAQALNRELLATQHLLSEASRQHERTRIARNLHDLLGHHLTALTIQLQVAERMSDGEARDKIQQSRSLARLLLSDVREAVATLRDQDSVDFRQSLELVIRDVPRLDIELDVDPGLRLDDVEVADALLRCVQEAITNTLRHTSATRAWVRVWRDGGRVRLSIRDNGRVREPLRPGNGLAGMRERIEQARGELTLNRIGEALQIDLSVPIGG